MLESGSFPPTLPCLGVPRWPGWGRVLVPHPSPSSCRSCINTWRIKFQNCDVWPSLLLPHLSRDPPPPSAFCHLSFTFEVIVTPMHHNCIPFSSSVLIAYPWREVASIHQDVPLVSDMPPAPPWGASKTLSMVAAPVFPWALDRPQHRSELGLLSPGLSGDTLVPQQDPVLRVSLPGWARAEQGSSRVILDTSVRGNVQNCVCCQWYFTMRTMGQRGRFSKILLKNKIDPQSWKQHGWISPHLPVCWPAPSPRGSTWMVLRPKPCLSAPPCPTNCQPNLHAFLQLLICLL